MAEDKLSNKTIGSFLGLLVHDLRNPTATVLANISFLQEVFAETMKEDEDLRGSIEDMLSGLHDLKHGLDQVAWIGRSLAGEPPLSTEEGSVKSIIREATKAAPFVEVETEYQIHEGTIVKGATTLSSILLIFLHNSRVHSPDQKATISVREEGENIVFAITDNGEPLSDEFQEIAFTIEGQNQIKNKAEGRYGRSAGLVAAKALADSIGVEIKATLEEGQSVFKIVIS